MDAPQTTITAVMHLDRHGRSRFTVPSHGVGYDGPCSVFGLSRVLVATGAPDARLEVRLADGRPSMVIDSIHCAAKWTLVEADDGFRLRRWRPFAGTELAGAKRDDAERRAA